MHEWKRGLVTYESKITHSITSICAPWKMQTKIHFDSKRVISLIYGSCSLKSDIAPSIEETLGHMYPAILLGEEWRLLFWTTAGNWPIGVYQNDELTGTSKYSVIPLPVCPRTPNDALSSMMSRTLYLYFSSILKKSQLGIVYYLQKLKIMKQAYLLLHLLFLEVVQCHHNWHKFLLELKIF